MNFSFPHNPSGLLVGALIASGIITTAATANLMAAGLTASLLADQAVLSNDRFTGHSFGEAVAVGGNLVVVGVDGGDPFASASVFERTGTSWRRLGRLTDSRASTYDGFGYSVAVDGNTIVVGDNFQNNAAYAFVPSTGPALNAWNITDANSSAVGPSYIVSLPAVQHAALLTNGWRYDVTARMVHPLYGGVCMYFSYGTATRRFIFFLHINSDGDLFAQLGGATPSQYVLTTNGVGADDYHLHEMQFDPGTGQATYFFDGTPVKTWSGEAITIAEGIRWGAGSTPGTGSINVHQVRFDMTGGGTLASYDAGVPGNSAPDLDPLAQGWSALNPAGAGSTFQEPLTPDIGTLWSEQARLTATGGTATDEFGSSVGISGDTMVVGAPYRSGGGAAYVFVRQGSNWTQQAMLTSDPPVANATFGKSVAIDGDTVVVGAPSSALGHAYAFVRTGTNWTQQTSFTAPAPDDQSRNGFASSVDISGGTIVIGAPDAGAPDNRGAVFVGTRTGGTWSPLTRLLPSSPDDYTFGTSVAIDGETLLVASEVLTGYVFGQDGGVWTQTARRVYPNTCEGSSAIVAIDGETIVAGVPSGCAGEGSDAGVVYVQTPDYSDSGAVVSYARKLLYYPDAQAAGPPFDANRAAFRYKDLLYAQDSLGVRAHFETMSNFYGQAERDLADQAEGEVLRGLAFHPDDAGLGNLLLDICYDRTVGETILAKDVLTAAEQVRLDPSSNALTFVIDKEIPLYRQVVSTNRFALQCYFDLLKQDLNTQASGPPTIRWAARVLGFSSQWTNDGPSNWYALQVLGEPDTYPAYGDLSTAWASATADDQREFLELAYDNPSPIDTISIYETDNPGAVDKISVRNQFTGLWQEVWSGTAASAGATARVFTVAFPLTGFPVDAVRLDINSPVVPGWNEIDAVSISGPGPAIPMTDPMFGYHVFQTLVPDRGLAPATYTNASGMSVVVTTNSAALTNGLLFTGYKDLVLLFNLLRDEGRAANTLGTLLTDRNDPGDSDEARDLVAETQQFLFLQGTLLKNMFPTLPPSGDPSGLAEAIEAWQESLNSFETLRAVLAGDINPLGFTPDFLMLIENFQDPLNPRFDSFDSFQARLSLSSADSTLRRAHDQLLTAREDYDQYRGYEDQIADQFDQSTASYDSRLFDIVGARPGQPDYSDNPTNNPGSELDQQYRSIDIARLRILKNSLEISNVTEQVNIEIARAAAVSNTVVAYGKQQASLTRVIGHINAAQAGMNELADTFSPRNLMDPTKIVGLAKKAFGLGIFNAVVQAGGEEAKGQLEAKKEELAGQERAELEGIEAQAHVKTLLLSMSTLAVDSLEAGALLRQEVARMAGLYREKADLEARIAERHASIASRYFADPIHRLAAEASQVTANLDFADAQRWLFFMARALEYKWNTPFANFQYPPGGRIWSTAAVFKLRNADELVAFYDAMLAFDGLINRGKTYRFDWFSVREDFMGLHQTNELGQLAMYPDPETGEMLDAISLFRTNLLRTVRQVQGGQEIVLEFNTVRQIPGGFFFVGPTFDLDGNVLNKGRFLDKIDYLQIRLPGHHTLGRSQLAGNLTYAGTSFIRNFNVGHFDPNRPDHLIDEMTSYPTRYWFYDPSPDQMRWRFNEGLTIDSVEMELTPDPRIPPTVTQIEEFKERSVAATGWKLTIPLVQQNVQVLRIDELDDVEIYFHHYSAQRQ